MWQAGCPPDVPAQAPPPSQHAPPCPLLCSIASKTRAPGSPIGAGMAPIELQALRVFVARMAGKWTLEDWRPCSGLVLECTCTGQSHKQGRDAWAADATAARGAQRTAHPRRGSHRSGCVATGSGPYIWGVKKPILFTRGRGESGRRGEFSL